MEPTVEVPPGGWQPPGIVQFLAVLVGTSTFEPAVAQDRARPIAVGESPYTPICHCRMASSG
jgi:hypothetical protein